VPRKTIVEWVVIFLVSLYLAAVGFWLLLTRKIPSPGLRRIFSAQFRPRYKSVLTDIHPENGHCFVATVPDSLLSDQESASSVIVYEDGRALGPPHSSHEEIRRFGEGRFSHWGNQIYLSASDNSNPTHNGRRYSVEEVAQ
jgi:hypothetical protein